MSSLTPQPHHPPATPTYILRGHVVPIHALQVFNKNLRLVSGDADGWIVVWDLIFKRPVAVWKAHDGAVLEVKGFSLRDGAVTEIYTHGRDHKLRVWRFKRQDEEILHKTLPVDQAQSQSQTQNQTQPWLIHSLPVNALNFCAFSMLFLPTQHPTPQQDDTNEEKGTGEIPPSSSLIAVPNALDSGALDIFHLPRERRICTIPTDPSVKTGMVMAANLIRPSSSASSGDLYVAAAYEDGHVMVFGCRGAFHQNELLGNSTSGDSGKGNWKWDKLYTSRPHSQPALSIDAVYSAGYFISSSADAMVVKHPLTRFQTGNSRVVVAESPMKSVNTKHAGQQGLRIRSDGKIFATAGWDSRVRVYSCKTMKELAVLKWHKEGCYAVAFADVSSTSTSTANSHGPSGASTEPSSRVERGEHEEDKEKTAINREDYSLAQVHRQRSLKIQNTHWLAAGSKDGKISLWDIY